MFPFPKNLKNKYEDVSKQKGMTYVELIVVLGIFAVLGGSVLLNYKSFQSKVDIKNLANDIAIKLVEAQKSSTSGKWNTLAPVNWSPSYGLYFHATSTPKSFISFADLDQNKNYDGLGVCPGNECLERVSILKGNSISSLKIFYQDGTSTQILNDLHVTFTRPDPGATFMSTTPLGASINYLEITISSPQSLTAKIKLYASGRIQIN